MNKPLKNRKILITREEYQCKGMISKIEALGGSAVSFPTIKITDPEDWNECDDAIRDLKEYDWVVFTSSNGVNYFMKRKSMLGNIDPFPSVATVGKKTAEIVREYGVPVDIIPPEFNAESLVRIFSEIDLTSKRILWPASDLSSNTLKEALSQKGASVDKITCYRNKPFTTSDPAADKKLLTNVDCYAFFSPSQFKSFLAFPEVKNGFLRTGNRPAIAAIGPVTARSIRKRGFKVDIMPEMSVEESLIDAIAEFYNRN